MSAAARYAGSDKPMRLNAGLHVAISPGIFCTLRRWIDAASLDARERYLSRATDQADLARRERAWEEAEQRRSLISRLSFPP